MENKYYLLTPRVDFLLIGGLGLLAYFIILIFFNIFGLNLSWQIKLSYWMIILAFFVNSPHFLISYLIFYRENSDKLFKLNRYALVGL